MADVHEVTTVLGRTEVRAGRIHRTRTSGAFEYDSDHLRRRDAFALVPALGMFPRPQPLSPAAVAERLGTSAPARRRPQSQDAEPAGTAAFVPPRQRAIDCSTYSPTSAGRSRLGLWIHWISSPSRIARKQAAS